MALEQGQCAVIRFECGVVLPGSLNAVRGTTFTFDSTRDDWGFLTWTALHQICERVYVCACKYTRSFCCISLFGGEGYPCDPFPDILLTPHVLEHLPGTSVV